jgi:adenylate cyclase
LSGDPAQDYVSDGMTEDVINGLSRFSGLSVIARNSSFTYKGRAVDVRDVGEQLGVRYIVEGSVRRFDERIRIIARLVDTQSGVQRWSDHFDRALGDVFAVQDEITQSIVAIVVAHLSHAEIERASRKPAGSWTAYDLTLQGDRALMLAEQLWDARHVYDARRLYAEAMRIEPDSARICAKLGHTYVRAYADPTSPDLGSRKELEQGLRLARQAVGLGPNLPLARAQLGWAYAWMKQPDEAIAEFERAAALNPSFVDYRFSLILTFAGEPERALRVESDYVRLDPFYGSMLPVIRGIALYLLKRYPEALAALRECRGRAPHVPGQAVLAATLVRLDQLDEAKSVVAELLARLPNLTSARWPLASVFRNPTDAELLFDALGEAGLP